MAPRGGLEPPTNGLTVLLSYSYLLITINHYCYV